jgi:transposase
MERDGLLVDSQTLWDQLNALAAHLKPTHDALREYLIKKPVIHADETPWYMLTKKPVKKWYVWCVTAEDASYFWLRGSRSAAAAKEGLNGYRGVVVVDGYKAYETLAREKGARLTLAFCWAHVRRRYVEAEPFYPNECKAVLGLIGQLFELERKVPDPALLTGDERKAALKLRDEVRKDRSIKLVEQIYEWALAQNALPKSALRKAIDYMFGLWEGLQVFLKNPLVPLSNNHAERGLRGPVVGRKNHYGSKSDRGADVTALFYSLLETAKLVGVDPRAYLIHAARQSIDQPGSSVFPHVLLPKANDLSTNATPTATARARNETIQRGGVIAASREL